MNHIYLKRHLRYLVDPHTGADLLPTEKGGLMAVDNLECLYPIEKDIIHLSRTDLRSVSAAYDALCQKKGRLAPTVDEFMSLPRQGLPGWGASYWEQRALSLAGVWHYLEAERRKAPRRCVGFQGTAAVLSPNLPYIAYGLEVGGYATYALSPHAGIYGLGVYGHGRYCRVQITWDAIPLHPHSFDVVILSEVLPSLDSTAAKQLLRTCAGLLVKKGSLLITDTPEVETYRAWLHQAGLKVRLAPLRGLEDNLTARVRSLLRQGLAAPPLLIAQYV